MPIVVLGLIALMLVFIQNYMYKRLWDKKLIFNANFSSNEAFEGDTLQLEEELINKKFLPLPWVRTILTVPSDLKLLDSDGELIPPKGAGKSIFSVLSYTAIKKRQAFVCQKRGVYVLRKANISISNLLHNDEFNKDFKVKGELHVFPKLIHDAIDIDIVYKYLDSAVLSNALINPDPFEFKGIRDYLPTDSLKAVNFKASAVSQKLMVNIHAPATAKRMVIVLNVEKCEEEQPFELYEQAIRLTATIARRYIDEDVQIGFFTNGRDSGTAETMKLEGGLSVSHLYKIYECLARLSLSYKSSPINEYMDMLTDTEQVYLFISPNFSKKTLESFEELNERGVDAHMIVPYFKGTNVPKKDKVMDWEAN